MLQKLQEEATKMISGLKQFVFSLKITVYRMVEYCSKNGKKAKLS